MLSRTPRRSQRRGRALVVVVLAALALSGVLAPSAPAAVRSNVQTALAGSHSFAGVSYDISGSASITAMQIPREPVPRVLAARSVPRHQHHHTRAGHECDQLLL